MCDTYAWKRGKHNHKRQAHPPLREDVTLGLTKRISGRDSRGAWRQDEVIGGKPTVVK
jgi:hypothetical protein